MSDLPDMQETINRLRKFALDLIGDYPDIPRIDRYDVAALAEANGLILKHTQYEPCEDGCPCAEYHTSQEFSQGVNCFELHPALKILPQTGDRE